MKFAGFIKQSLVDYPGEIAAVLFVRGCNLCCPFCHNGDLIVRSREAREQDIDETVILDFLRRRRNFLDAVVISGGEPGLFPELADFMAQVREWGYLVKLDTNGTNPAWVQSLLEQGLLDYVAMDVKHALVYGKYYEAAGKISKGNFFHIKSTLQILKNAPTPVMAEFRTTVIPALHQPEDITAIAQALQGAKLYTLQQFRPKQAFQPLWRDLIPYRREEMEALAELCVPYVEQVRIVNM
jgi:pyruvate formate lyase activating enzyme